MHLLKGCETLCQFKLPDDILVPLSITGWLRQAFTDDDRVELIEGEIIEMNPIGSRHAACVGRLTEILGRSINGNAIVWVQNPVQVNDYSEPLPDVALLKRRADFYAQANPQPADVLLIVEVADSSVEYDHEIKIPLYAAVGIVEVWLVNITKEIIEVYRQPVNGIYQEVGLVRRGESIAVQSLPNAKVDVNDVLG